MLSIGTYAFYGCEKLATITIPASVNEIGDAPFAKCSELKEINVQLGNTNYSSVNGILFTKDNSKIISYPCGKQETTYLIPSSVTCIGSQAFSYCADLVSITLPEGVTSIEWGAYYNCTKLQSVEIPSSISSIDDFAFCGCSSLASVKVWRESPLDLTENVFTNRMNAILYVPAGCKAVYETANYWKDFKEIVELSPIINFADSNVKAICIAKWDTDGDGELSEAEAATVKDLGEIFKSNSSITSFDELQYFTGLTNINANAFGSCISLTSIAIPNGVTTIGNLAFNYCKKLTTVAIPNSVCYIGRSAFHQSDNLSKVHITDIAAWCNISFDGAVANPLSQSCDLYLNGEELKDLKIPLNVLEIGEFSFYNCRSLNSVIIPENITTIGRSAFCYCSNLSYVSIPNSVEEIGIHAFNGCNLTMVIVKKDTPISISEEIIIRILEIFNPQNLAVPPIVRTFAEKQI